MVDEWWHFKFETFWIKLLQILVNSELEISRLLNIKTFAIEAKRRTLQN